MAPHDLSLDPPMGRAWWGDGRVDAVASRFLLALARLAGLTPPARAAGGGEDAGAGGGYAFLDVDATVALATTRCTGRGGPSTPGEDLLTDRQRERLTVLFTDDEHVEVEAPHGALTVLFTDDEHVEVEATWGILQRVIGAYRNPDRATGRAAMANVIDALGKGVPPALVELRRLGRTLNQGAADVLAYFDRPAPPTAQPRH